jgi:hypothetical protein
VAETPVSVIFDTELTATLPVAVVAETPVIGTAVPTNTLPVAVVAETPVTSTVSGVFHAPEFQVPLFQPVTRAIRQSVLTQRWHY